MERGRCKYICKCWRWPFCCWFPFVECSVRIFIISRWIVFVSFDQRWCFVVYSSYSRNFPELHGPILSLLVRFRCQTLSCCVSSTRMKRISLLCLEGTQLPFCLQSREEKWIEWGSLSHATCFFWFCLLWLKAMHLDLGSISCTLVLFSVAPISFPPIRGSVQKAVFILTLCCCSFCRSSPPKNWF